MNYQIIIKDKLFSAQISQIITEEWGSTIIISRGISLQTDNLPAFIAVQENNLIGLIIYNIVGLECEIVALKSLIPGQGIATHLINNLKSYAKEQGCQTLSLVTTNDNLDALNFYQRPNRGFSLKKLHLNSIDKVRKLKPQIPLIAENGIAIRDEIELELIL